MGHCLWSPSKEQTPCPIWRSEPDAFSPGLSLPALFPVEVTAAVAWNRKSPETMAAAHLLTLHNGSERMSRSAHDGFGRRIGAIYTPLKSWHSLGHNTSAHPPNLPWNTCFSILKAWILMTRWHLLTSVSGENRDALLPGTQTHVTFCFQLLEFTRFVRRL